VVRALILNATTPLSDAMDLLPQLSDQELRTLLKDRGGHPPALQSKARQILDVRKKKRSF
jgi:hypothetical protein